ncbi:GDYXXLXY domain-containing protein [Pseudaestuariivita atlantica]|uniref:GDYXXLXY domain-containing protein n=1 Tax=Pseudaestuariivita atlantica TaxID=1317121 RepID=A0A0L1JRC2_9RHOB|nr:GDYXXLXY domain-containing protein [Pseudaestuariivita atlantica]KNG94349.1 hypothetical protein ATO11_09150 [Pseudaestuariivita atlantica]
MTRRWMLIGGIAVAAALQTAALAKMITDRAALIRDGQEVVLETGMVDPRDLFRGHYVTLDLVISRLDTGAVTVTGDLTPDEPVWAILAEGEDGFWRPTEVTTTRPATDAPVLQGTFRYAAPDQILIDFPFGRYYAPKDRAQELEVVRNDRALGLIVALDPEGHGAIKGVTVNGEPVYLEPLY